MTPAAALLFFAGAAGSPASADDHLAGEYAFKAAFLYNIVKFVQWPPGTLGGDTAPIEICVVGRDPFQGLLGDAVAGRSVGSHALEVSLFPDASDAAGLRACQMVFLSSSEQARAETILRALNGAPVLTVAEWEGFVKSGGMIRLLIADDKLAFEIDKDRAEAARLRISSQLLKLARNAHRGSVAP